jgi:serine/threonine protein kinase
MSSLVGTAFYIAPEVLDGAYGKAADMWSLGCIVYMMITGEIPIPGRDDQEVMQNVAVSYMCPRSGWSVIGL